MADDLHFSLACQDDVHAVTLTNRGALILHEHPTFRAEKALIALGAEPRSCLQFWQQWVYRSANFETRPAIFRIHDDRPSSVWAQLSERHKASIERHNARQQWHALRHALESGDPCVRALRWQDRITSATSTLIHELRYTSLDRAPVGVNVYLSAEPFIHALSSWYDGWYDGIDAQTHRPRLVKQCSIIAGVTFLWWRLFQRHEAVIDGCLVLHEYRGKYGVPQSPRLVLAAREDVHGYLHACQAHLIGGHLAWLDR